MKYAVALPSVGANADPESIIKIAQVAEALGFDTAWLPDHVVVPEIIESRYPFTADGEWRIKREEAYLEALTTISFVAGKTSRLRLGTNVLVVSCRNPVLTAKMVATIDYLSGGRVTLGIGVGWCREEFEALGAAAKFSVRGSVTDEYVEIFRKLWREPVSTFRGQHYAFDSVYFAPKPIQDGGPPIFIGGHTEQALKRVGKIADGWTAVRLAPREIAAHKARIDDYARVHGRDPSGIEIAVVQRLQIMDRDLSGERSLLCGSPEQVAQDIRAYDAAGVTMLGFGLYDRTSQPPTTLAEMVSTLERFDRDVRPLV